ncbi:redox-sensitive bicupin YhaK (pirin superfamily) [Undibacterium sp. GrIS 1.8]|uniref:pirin-like C-terminal cupin domain-containing protein n=1 Tax=unclassified Undibacterium TaxID=2630295 RepID=UPI003397A733
MNANTRRKLFFFKGASLNIDGQIVPQQSAIEVRGTSTVELINGSEPSEILMLQGTPIGEPVAQHGLFVMNSDEELRQAYADYRRTQFGGWPWPSNAPVHGSEQRDSLVTLMGVLSLFYNRICN